MFGEAQLEMVTGPGTDVKVGGVVSGTTVTTTVSVP